MSAVSEEGGSGGRRRGREQRNVGRFQLGCVEQGACNTLASAPGPPFQVTPSAGSIFANLDKVSATGGMHPAVSSHCSHHSFTHTRKHTHTHTYSHTLTRTWAHTFSSCSHTPVVLQVDYLFPQFYNTPDHNFCQGQICAALQLSLLICTCTCVCLYVYAYILFSSVDITYSL